MLKWDEEKNTLHSFVQAVNLSFSFSSWSSDYFSVALFLLQLFRRLEFNLPEWLLNRTRHESVKEKKIDRPFRLALRAKEKKRLERSPNTKANDREERQRECSRTGSFIFSLSLSSPGKNSINIFFFFFSCLSRSSIEKGNEDKAFLNTVIRRRGKRRFIPLINHDKQVFNKEIHVKFNQIVPGKQGEGRKVRSRSQGWNCRRTCYSWGADQIECDLTSDVDENSHINESMCLFTTFDVFLRGKDDIIIRTIAGKRPWRQIRTSFLLRLV